MTTCHSIRGHRGCGHCDRCRALGKGPSGWALGEFYAAMFGWLIGTMLVVFVIATAVVLAR